MNLENLENVFVLLICTYVQTCNCILYYLLGYKLTQPIKSLLCLLLIGCIKPYSMYLFLDMTLITCRAACYACNTAN